MFQKKIQELLSSPFAIVGLAIVATLVLVAADSFTRKKSRAHKPRVYVKCALLALLVSSLFLFFRPYTPQPSIVSADVPADEIFQEPY